MLQYIEHLFFEVEVVCQEFNRHSPGDALRKKSSNPNLQVESCQATFKEILLMVGIIICV